MVRRFLAEKSPVSEVRRLMATEPGYDQAVWAQLGQLGLAGLTIPEKYGGAGCGPVEQMIVCEEMGAALLCAPYLASAVLATWALLAGGDPVAQADLLPAIASGESIATLAVREDDGSWAPEEFRVTARRSGEEYLLDGRKSFVLDGMVADMLLEVESARSAAYHAAWAAADGAADLPLVASLAKAYCSEAYFHVAASNIQVHGGIGFTWEHDAPLYYRRAKSAEVMLGTPASHREVVAGLLLKDAAG